MVNVREKISGQDQKCIIPERVTDHPTAYREAVRATSTGPLTGLSGKDLEDAENQLTGE